MESESVTAAVWDRGGQRGTERDRGGRERERLYVTQPSIKTPKSIAQQRTSGKSRLRLGRIIQELASRRVSLLFQFSYSCLVLL